MSKLNCLSVAIAGACSVVLGFTLDFLNYCLMEVSPDPMGNMRSQSYELLLLTQAQARAGALSHLGIALMFFGIVLVALAVHAALPASVKQDT